MYCPECGVEYRPGFPQCSDCLVPLVAERPRRTRSYATVLEESDPDLIALAAELLKDAGVPFSIIRGECGGEGGADEQEVARPCRLEVLPELEVQARAVLQSMETTELHDEYAEGTAAAPEPNLELVVVFEGDDRLVLSSARQELERAGIPLYVEGEELGVMPYLNPWCRIQVGTDRQGEALELLRPFRSGESSQEDGNQAT